MEFKEFASLLAKNFSLMTASASPLYRADISGDDLWEAYLDSFPPGANEVYRERREMDCSACRHFVRQFGNVVAVSGNRTVSIWRFDSGDSKFQTVLDTLAAKVERAIVADVLVSKQTTFGHERDHENRDGHIHTWNHLCISLPKERVYKGSDTEAGEAAKWRDIRQVLQRSLEEISVDAVETTLDLISQKSLYRGEEWQKPLEKFLEMHREYHDLQETREKDVYCWRMAVAVGAGIGKIRNHSIGTLLIDLTEGMELDNALKRYEKVVAPANYKRPKAIFTKKMVEEARQKVKELSLEGSLGRRFAHLDDITVNNVLWANRNARKVMAGDPFAELEESVPVDLRKLGRVEDMAIDTFLADVLPRSTSIEALVEGRHRGNFVSLIAPTDKDAPPITKWGNNFGWAYAGNVADSDLRSRVAELGGRVDGVLRFSHSWNHNGQNQSLMDLHVFMPGSTQRPRTVGGREIHDNYGADYWRVGWNRRNDRPSGGVQDVDHTAEPGRSVPVENITFPDLAKMPEGQYIFKIHNWKERSPNTEGFRAEIEFGGDIYQFEYREPVLHKQWITLAKITLKNGVFTIDEMMENSQSTQEIWGVKAPDFHPVQAVTYSPNYWDGQDGIGHRHIFFMIEKAINPDTPNGFFNEYLPNSLMEHKRVFEALGAKMKVEPDDNQLSGLGFSTTKRSDLVVRVSTGRMTRLLKIQF